MTTADPVVAPAPTDAAPAPTDAAPAPEDTPSAPNAAADAQPSIDPTAAPAAWPGASPMPASTAGQAAAPVVAPSSVDSVELSGTVTKPDGAAAGGIDISVFYTLTWTGQRYDVTTTAEDGTWSMTVPASGEAVLRVLVEDPLGAYPRGWYGGPTGWVSADVLATSITFADATVSGIDIRFPSSVPTIAGRVTDAADQPVAGVPVSAYANGGQAGTGWTDENGDYTISASAGEYSIGVYGAPDYGTGWYSTSGFVYESAAASPVSVPDEGLTGIDIVLPAALHISGTIRDAAGDPVEGIDVVQLTTENSWLSASVSAADGTYELRTVPGSYVIGISDPSGLQPTGYWGSGGFAYAFDQAAPLTVADADLPAHITLPVPHRISGRVTSEAGSGVAGIDVSAEDGEGSSGHATTGPDGTYVMALAPSAYHVCFSSSTGAYPPGCWTETGFAFAGDPGTVSVVSGSQAGIDVVLPAARHIKGTISGANGAGPLPGRGITAFRVGGGASWATTDADGSYSILLVEGTYRVQVDGDGDFTGGWYTPSGFVTEESQAADISVTGEDVTLDLTLPVALHITGRVTDGDGNPLAGIYVSAQAPGGAPARASRATARMAQATGNSPFTDGDGTYSLALAAGTYTVSFDDWSGTWIPATYPQAVVLTTGDAGGIDATLARRPRISGTITAAGGGPLAGIHVTATAATDGMSWDTFTGPDGAYALGVLPGTFTVQVDMTDGYLGGWYTPSGLVQSVGDASAIDTTSGDVAHVDLALPAALHIRGTVTRAGGGAVDGASLTVIEASGSWGFESQPAEDGTYALAVWPGTYSISIRDATDRTRYAGWYGASGFTFDGDAATAVSVSAADTTGVDIVLPALHRLTGTVTDAVGTPLGGIDVAAGGPAWPGTSTRADGTYALTVPDGIYTIDAQDPGRIHLAVSREGVVVAGADVPGIDITMAAALRIRGRISGAGAAGVANVHVQAYALDGAQVDSTWTTPAGDYWLAVAPGTYKVRVSGTSAWAPGWYAAEGYVTTAAAATPVVVTTVDVPGINVVLPPIGHIRGVVTAAGSGPLADVMVVTRDADGHYAVAQSGPDGTYALGVASGTYTVSFQPPTDAYAAGWYATTGWVADSRLATPIVVAGADRTGISVAMPAAHPVRGTITTGGHPLAGIVVIAVNAAGHEIAGDSSGRDGTYSVAVASGDYALRVVDPEARYAGGWWTAGGLAATQAGATVVHVAGSPVTGRDAALVLDTAAPSVGVPVAVVAAGGVLSGSAVPVTVTWKASDPGTDVASVEFSRSTDGGATWSAPVRLGPVLSTTVAAPASGTVVYRVRATDRAGNTSGWKTGAKATYRLVQQSSSAVVYRGTWSTRKGTGYSGGSEKWSKAAGASATWKVTARSVALVATRGIGRGKARIYVDGKLVKTVDLTRTSTQYRHVAWQASWSKSATHTVKVVVAGTSGRPRVDLDAFVTVR